MCYHLRVAKKVFMKGFRMIETIIDLCIDTIVDSAKLIPFLFLTYLAME